MTAAIVIGLVFVGLVVREPLSRQRRRRLQSERALDELDYRRLLRDVLASGEPVERPAHERGGA